MAVSGDENVGRAPAKRMEQHMHRNLDVFKDPLFWGAIVFGVWPIVLGGMLLVWLH
jgi:hypothetical protein